MERIAPGILPWISAKRHPTNQLNRMPMALPEIAPPLFTN
jgi:hypothetical protein